MSTIYQTEKFSDVIEESLPLLRKHWLELARNQDKIPLEINVDGYKTLERLGLLKIFTVRESSHLIGYAAYVINYHPHYKTTKFANSDIFWVDPTHRGKTVGVRLFKFIEEQLKLEGVDVMHTSYKLAHPAAQRVLDFLGHNPIEMTYEKVLK